MSGRGECVYMKLQERHHDLVDRSNCCGLDEDAANLRFEVGVESSAAETEGFVVILRNFNS